MTTHALLSAFKANKPAFGAWLTSSSYIHARAVAKASPSMSWLMLDCEHGLISLNPGAHELISAISSVGPNAPSTLVRIPATGTSTGVSWQIKYALDAGARGAYITYLIDEEDTDSSSFPLGVLVPMASRQAFSTTVFDCSFT